MKKAFDQTVRDIKREVNKKVLKVPSIEQKVLDCTSNEPWGPHGSLLADIAQATRNYHEYHMIMSVIWKRINDTGKNWRHVYKALTVLEYLVAHGSERVIDEMKEHAYQISTLSDFQYIDSSGRDQGSNVRKKSQFLVALVNDKERIQEVRQKAIANRDKFRGPSSTGGLYRPNSYSGGYGDRFDDDRYDDRNSYEREREWGHREDDRYGRNSDPYGRDIDHYSRDSDERNARDRYRDDVLRGRSRSVDKYRYSSRSRSSDRDRAYEDDGQHSSRGSIKADNQSQDGRRLDRKFSEQNLGAPPSYEEAVSGGRSPVPDDRRDGENAVASAPKPSSPPVTNGPSQPTIASGTSASPVNQEIEASDEFDPRSSVTAAPTTSISAEGDLLGSLSDSFTSNALAIMPAESVTTASEAIASATSGLGPAIAAASSATSMNKDFDDPFGDSPFKALPSTQSQQAQPQNFASTASFQATMNSSTELSQPTTSEVDAAGNLGFEETLPGVTYATSDNLNAQLPSTNNQFLQQDFSASPQNSDILADILPPRPLPTATSQVPFPAQNGQPTPFGPSPALTAQTAFPAPPGNSMQPGANLFGAFQPQGVSMPPVASHMVPQMQARPSAQYYDGSGLPQPSSVSPMALQVASQSPVGALPHQNSDVLGSVIPQAGQSPTSSSPAPSTGALTAVPKTSKDKFDPKSTVWADTLSRGLVNLNISGPKINPLADIGIDFDAINRKEKRLEKTAAAPIASNVTMGKAMGSGSGIGRAGAGALRPPANPMNNPGTGMGMGMGLGMGMGIGGGPNMGIGGRPNMGMGGGPTMGMGMGMGVGGYGGMNQQPTGMGMGMNMGMGQGVQMQQQTGLPPGSAVPGGYNPMIGGGYGAQQPYGGGYR